MRTGTKWLTWSGVLLLAGLVLVPAISRADDDDDDEEEEHGRRSWFFRDRRAPQNAGPRATPTWAKYQEECGSCHMAFPPGMLPARSWAKLLSGLDDHFGQNAELDPATQKELGAWLATWAAESGSSRRSGAVLRSAQGSTPLRITELAFWRHEHDEISPSVFKRRSVGSPANCPACHQGADQGDFNEHSVKIPPDAAPAR